MNIRAVAIAVFLAFMGEGRAQWVDLSKLLPVVPFAPPTATAKSDVNASSTVAGSSVAAGSTVAGSTATADGSVSGGTVTAGSTVAAGTVTGGSTFSAGGTVNFGGTYSGGTYIIGGNYAAGTVTPTLNGAIVPSSPAANSFASASLNQVNVFPCATCPEGTVIGYMNYPIVNPNTNIINVGFPGDVGTTITTMGGIHPVPPYPLWVNRYPVNYVSVPTGNYLAPGVDAQLVPLLAPNAECSLNEWLVKAQTALQTGNDFVPDMENPTDVYIPTRLEYSDFVNTLGRFAYFRNKPLLAEWGCQQTGSHLVLAVVVRQSDEPVSLSRIDWGIFSSESNLRILRIVDFRFRGMGDYGYRNGSLAIGYQHGPDGDDVTIGDGFGGGTPVDELYVTGWGFRKNIGDVGSLLALQRYFAGKCYYISGYAVGYGTYTGKVKFALRVDIPVGWTPTYRYTVAAGAPGFISVNIIGWKAGLYFIEGTNGDPGNPNTVWTRFNQVPIPPGRYSLASDQLTTYLRVTQR